MGKLGGKTCRLLTMIVLTTIFFLVEIIVGYATGSVALIADSFHMLSDIISLIVGLTAVKMSKKTTSKNTYGWQRAEVLGALVNSVFLIALCFTIVVEAVQRFIEFEVITDPELVLIVGGVGLLINLIGLLLFWKHGMSHGHSHGGGSSHSHGSKSKPKKTSAEKSPETIKSDNDFNYTKVPQGTDVVSQPNGLPYTEIEGNNGNAMAGNQNPNDKHSSVDMASSNHEDDHHHHEDHEEIDSSGQLNMRGVFLHVLGDALGSVVVIISALCIMFVDGDWKYYLDPVMSLIIVVIIITTTIPLFKQSSMILLQSLPTDVDIDDIEDRLLRKIGGIENVHEFHIWQLSSDKIIATAHIRFSTIQDYVKAAQELKTFLHDEGIHSSTIQPEFSSDMMIGSQGIDDTDCMLKCQPEGDCRTMTCCDNQTTVKQRRRSSTDKGRRKSQPQTPPAPTRKSSPPENDTAMGLTLSSDHLSGREENV